MNMHEPVSHPAPSASPPLLRVLYVVSLFPCWSETFIVREIQQLQQRGVEVHIVSLKHASETLVQSDAQAMLGRVIYPPGAARVVMAALRAAFLRPWQTGREWLGLVRGLWRHPAALAKSGVVWARTMAMLPRVAAARPQHLHAHWATYPSTAAMWLGARLRLPYSFTAHAHDIFLEDHLLAAKLRTAAFGVTISRFNREFLSQRISPLARERLRIVHCGVAPQRYAFRADGRVPGRVLSVGRLDPIKGFDHLIQACAVLRDRGVDFHCQIIGDGPLRQALEAQIANHRLQPQVQLLGACPQEQVRQALESASVFALASVVTPQGDRDGIPVALMEAMACGTPVVSTRVSGIPELIVHGRSGLLAEPADARSLADAIEAQLEDGERARAMALAARRTIEDEFDVAKEAAKLHAAFA